MAKSAESKLGSNGLVITDAYKSYGKQEVLKGLNMRVPIGSVYAILGASGCGKSTILHSVIDQLSLDSGTILIGWKKKSHLGYMPQEIALYPLLKINEVFHYYARIFGVEGTDFQQSLQELTRLLVLPPTNTVIRDLSGGEQRRVSFAVAFLHDPQFLILDEPTVGLDPVLRNNIWEFLMMTSRVNNKMIIITTHYIEEARQANMVGIMRGGCLLAEESPETLISRFNCNSLEHVFLELSKEQNNICLEVSKPKRKMSRKESKLIKPDHIQNSIFSFRRYSAELIKNILFLRRSKPMLCFQLLLPLIQILLFNYAFGRYPTDLGIGVVNEEWPKVEECPINLNNNCTADDLLSCDFYNLLKPHFKLIPYNTVEEAKQSVMKHEIWAVLNFPLNYTETLLMRMTDHFFSGKIPVEFSQVNVWMDNSDYTLGYHIKDKLVKVFQDLFSNALITCGWSNKASLLPISIKDPIYGLKDTDGVATFAGQFLAINLFYFPMAFSAGALMEEKASKILKRSSVAGVRLPEVYSGLITVQMVLLIFQVYSMWYFYAAIFGISSAGSMYLVFFFLYLQGLEGIMCGIFLTSAMNSLTASTITVIMITSGCFYVGGIIWPVQGMYPGIRFVEYLVPTTLIADGISSVMIKAWTLAHYGVLRGLISVIVWMGLFCVGTIVSVNYKTGLFF